jgi:hypothetical protein
MAYGTIKVDNITFTNGGSDQTTTVSGLYAAITSGVTVSGTISGNTIQGQTISGVTITGTTIQGASGTFTSLTGVTTTGTTANFVTHNGASGVFTTLISGATITGTTAQFTNITGGGIGATTITGTTVSGTTANFVSGVFTTRISGVTVTGTTASFTSGVFTSLSGTTTTVTSGIFGAGSATAPSVAVGTGTTYTPGIYSPGTDQLAISTNGSHRLRVDSSGSLLVATTTDPTTGTVSRPPISLKQLNDSSSFSAIHIEANADQSLLGIGYNGSAFGISTSYRGTGAFKDIFFATSNIERMRIDSSGRVGIGTSSPGTSRTYIQVDDTNTVGLTINGISSSGGVSSYSSLKITGATPNAVGTHYGVEFIKSASNVESITGYYASITGTYNTQTNFYAKLTKDLGASTNGYCYYADLATSNSGGAAYFAYFYNSTSAAERFSITNAGTTTLTSAASTAPFIAKIGSSEVSRIDSSGRLLVGTSSALSNVARFGADATPTTQFLTNTESWSTGLGLINYSPSGFAPALTFGLSGSSTVGTNAVVSSGNRLGLITFNGNDGTNFEEGARIEAFVDATPGANDMPGRLVLSTTADGSASPTERMRIDNAGRVLVGTSTANTSGAKLQTSDGLTFPTTQVASSDPNTLDDYEEGTWTPTQGAGLTVVGAYSSTGYYTKTGNQVVVFASLFGATSIASSTAGILCGGLPFTPAPPSSGYVVGSMTNQAGNISNTCFSLNSANVYGAVAIVANSGIHFTMTYRV